MSTKTPDHTFCPTCGLHGFFDERDADRALGQARTRRNRTADKQGSRRGMTRENRTFTCGEGLIHLTSQSRRSFVAMGVTA
ncbi:hypothetical protein [Micromonospora sp. NPDC048839]|uniref:hypothetical protein n=1 Tax=Micromonospora sp. NPDC048839 TaxID=3155641 RepID=UPI00340E6751